METLKTFFVENWVGKLASLLIAISIWYLIQNHLGPEEPQFPVPGTGTPPPPKPATVPGLEDSILSPLAPPVPGNSDTR